MTPALPVLMAFASFGGTFDPSWTNAPSESRIYPVGSASVYRLVKPDGGAALFRLNGDVLVGERPWVGTKKRNRIDIWPDPSQTGGKVRTGMTFLNGQLRHLEIDGRPYDFPGGSPFGDGAFEKMYPKRKTRSMAKGSSGDIWKGDKTRIRLWFANPNSAGVFCAQILLLLPGLLVLPKVRSWIRKTSPARKALVLGPVGVAAVLALHVLLRTGSRGALLGVAIGGACLLAGFAKALLTKRGILLMAAGLTICVAAIYASGQGARLMGTFRTIDAGNRLRLKIARAATEMLADAPWGWKGGEVPARSACLNWYVPDEHHIIRTHLVTVAELGWLGGFAYFLGWFLLMGIGCRAFGRGNPLGLALFAALFVSGFLNPVYRDWELWVIPAFVAAACLTGGDRTAHWRRAPYFVGGAATLSALVMAGLVTCGTFAPRAQTVRVRAVGAAALVNGEKPSVWVVEDTATLGGFGFPGREILPWIKKHADFSIGYVHAVEDLPKAVETLVLPGRAAADYLKRLDATGAAPCTARRIVFLSPMARPDDVPQALLEAPETTVEWHVGSLAMLRTPANYRERRKWVYIHPGCELYLPHWLRIARGNDNVSVIPRG